MIDIQKSRALCAAATPGPWEHIHIFAGEEIIRVSSDEESPPLIGRTHFQPDGAFIAAARTLLPASLDEIERLRKALSDWLKAYDDTGPDNGPSLIEHDCALAARHILAALASPKAPATSKETP